MKSVCRGRLIPNPVEASLGFGGISFLLIRVFVPLGRIFRLRTGVLSLRAFLSSKKAFDDFNKRG